jgi:DNA helicase II / ATP-dependent DNA helicase PcrA
MDTRAFDAEYKKLNPEQREAVDSIEGPVMVVAGPGTGKTQVLTLRIANILKKTDTSPENILALTFTDAAATNMRRRLAEIIGSRAYQVVISTFHSFCNDIIKKHPESFPAIVGSEHISEVDQVRIIESCIDDESPKSTLELLRPFGNPHLYVPNIRRAIDVLKREGISTNRFQEIIQKERKRFEETPDLYHTSGRYEGRMKTVYAQQAKRISKNEELASLYERYQSILREQKQYDFADMIMETLSAISSDHDLLSELQETHQYILVDEHQDTNNAQNRIIEMIASFHASPNLFVVGDEKQAIFRFQGASLENFLYFEKRFKDVKRITLVRNYRSSQSILDSAGSILSGELPLEAHAGHLLAPISIAALSQPEAEADYIASDVEKRAQERVPYGEIGVLYPENADAHGIARALWQKGIPYTIESDQNLFDDADVSKLVMVLRAVENYGEDEDIARLMHIRWFGIHPLDTYRLLRFAHEQKISLYELVHNKKLFARIDLSKPRALQVCIDKISDWVSFASEEPLTLLVSRIIRESGILKEILSSPNAHDRMDALNSFFDEVQKIGRGGGVPKLKDFFTYLETIEKHRLSIKKHHSHLREGMVRLMTVHKAKGLEFDIVYIAKVYDGHFGGRRIADRLALPPAVYSLSGDVMPESRSEDDARRIFYVALSRARKHVVITYPREDDDGKELLPSQFITEIKPDLTEEINVREFEEKRVLESAKRFESGTYPVHDLKDKEFVRALFISHGMSVSALNNYLVCPWRYFYRNLIRIPEPKGKSALYGTAVHEALHTFFSQLKDRDVTKESLLSAFEQSLGKQPLTPRDRKDVLEKGKVALGGFYDTYYKTANRNVLVEFNVKGIELEEDIRITGKIDKIEFLGNGNEVNVVDYKTKKPVTRNAIMGKTKSNDTGDMYRQLVFYKLLLDLYEDGKPARAGEHRGGYKMVSGEISFVEPDDKGRYKSEKFVPTDEEVKNLKEEVLRVSHEILDLAFWDKACGDKKCEFCTLRSHMT